MRTDILIHKDKNLVEGLRQLNQLRGISRLILFVVDDEDRVVGSVTDGDIRRAMEKWQAKFFDHTVEDIMTRTPKTVLPNTKITEIQSIMHKYKIHTVLVCDKEQRLLGVVDHYSCML